MASKLADEPCNSETEAETIAMRIKRKRSQRVSFVDTEITSVHIFNRDEDSDNPPDSEPQSSSQNDSSEPEKGVVGFFKDLGGESDDFKDSDDEDDGRKSFLRPPSTKVTKDYRREDTPSTKVTKQLDTKKEIRLAPPPKSAISFGKIGMKFIDVYRRWIVVWEDPSDNKGDSIENH